MAKKNTPSSETNSRTPLPVVERDLTLAAQILSELREEPQITAIQRRAILQASEALLNARMELHARGVLRLF